MRALAGRAVASVIALALTVAAATPPLTRVAVPEGDFARRHVPTPPSVALLAKSQASELRVTGRDTDASVLPSSSGSAALPAAAAVRASARSGAGRSATAVLFLLTRSLRL